MNKDYMYLVLILLVSGCVNTKNTMQATYNKGGYQLRTYKKSEVVVEDSVLITGKISALNEANNLVAPIIKYGCNIQHSSTGEFRFKVKTSDVKLSLSASAVGYLTVDTEPLHTQAGDSLIVNFILAPDERPLLNCEGGSGYR